MSRIKGRRNEQQQIEQIPFKNKGDALRSELDETFKPIFESHEEDGGILYRDLKHLLIQHGAKDSFSTHDLNQLLYAADQNDDGRMSYEEFVTVITADRTNLISKYQLTRFQRFVRVAVTTAVPRGQGGDAFVDDYLSQYNCRPPPLFIIFISIIELVIFIVYAVGLSDTHNPVTAISGIPLYSPLIYNPRRRWEAWRFLTYMLLHQGYLHLVMNLIFQLFLGIPLEMVHKWWRVGIVYLLGVLAGSMCHSVFDVNTMLAGASGGCYALIGAHFAIIIMNWKEMTYEWMSGPVRFFSSAPVRLAIWTILAGIDTGSAIWKRYQGGTENIGYAAHFGGFLAGLLIGIPVLKNIDEKPWEKVVWWIALVAYLICVAMIILWNIFFPNFPETDWRPCCQYP